MSILDDIKKIFSGVASRDDAFVGIDIGSSSIKMVQLRKESGKILLETYGEVSLAPYDKDRVAGELTRLEFTALAKAITNLVEEANVTSKSASYSLSSSSSLIFTLSLPKLKESELHGMVQSEARKYIPIPLTEVSLDWWIIPKKESYSNHEDENAEVDVLVAAVRNEVLDHYNRVNREVKVFKEPAFEIETFSAIRGAFKHELSPVLVVDYGASGTRVSVVEHGVVRKFHAVSRGSHALSESLVRSLELQFSDAEKMKKEFGLNPNPENENYQKVIESGISFIHTEISNVLFEFEKDYKKPIGKIILVGGGSMLKGFKEQIQAKTSIETFHADPFAKVISPDFLEEALEEIGAAFAVSLGLALQNFK